MGRARQTGLKRRRLRTPAQRARARQLAALRQWLRQRGSVIAAVFVLLAPFAIMGALGGIRTALGAPPTSSPSRAGFAYTENAVVIVDPGITVTDDPPVMTDNRQITGFFTLVPPSDPSAGRLSVLSGTGPITTSGTGPINVFHGADQIGSYPGVGVGSGSGGAPLIIDLGGSVTITDTMVQDLMRAIAYEDLSNDPSSSPRTIELQIIDPDEGNGPPMSYNIGPITQVNDAPTITAPPETLNVNDDTDLAITTPTASTPIIIGDLDSGGNAIQTTLSVPPGAGVLTMTGGGGCTVGGSGTNAISLGATESAADACLATLVYRSAPHFSGTVTLSIAVNDNGFTVAGIQNVGQAQTANASVTINVTSVNGPPVLTVPGGQSILQYQPLAIPAIGLADSDAFSADMQVSLSVTKGVLAIGNQAGLTSVTGDGTASVVLVGPRAALDNALDSITYTSTATTGNLNDVLTIVANDLGNTGAGGPQSDTETVAITVNEFNDAPSITAPASATVTEDVPAAVGTITIADPDANPAADAVRMSISAAQGTLTFGSTTGLVFGIGDGTADGTMQFDGTINDINAALTTLTYQTSLNATTSTTLTLNLNDQGFTGAPGPQSAPPQSVTINITAVNDAPVITVPAAQNTNEDSALTFSTGNANLISVADPDAASGLIRVSLSVAQGTLTLSGTTGLTFPSGANGTAAMTVEGTLANINAALDGLVYQPALNYLGPDTLNVGANDQGNTGTGAPGSDNKSVAITVNTVNDPPDVTGPANISVNEDVPFTVPGVTVSDPDAGSASIEMTFSATNGTVSLTNTAGLTLTGGANGSNTVTFSGTIPAFNGVLGTLTYQTNLNSTAADTLVVTANDLGNTGTGGPLTDTLNIAVTVGGVNDGPTITVPAPSYNVAEEAVLTINGVGIQITDPDVGGGDVQVTLSATNGVLTLDPGASTAPPLTSVSGNGTSSVTFRGTLANVNNAISPLTYQGNLNYVGPDTVNIQVTDLGNTGAGGPLSDTDAIGVTVTAVNDAPVITAPGSIGVTEDTSSPLSGISVADVDAGSSPVLISVTVGTGTVTFGSTSGLTLAGGGNGTSAVSYSGTITNINAALTTLSYLTALNNTANDSLTVVVNDQGATGAGGALQDTEMITLTIGAVNDAPVLTVPGTQNGAEDTPLSIPGVSIADVDVGGGQIRVTLTAGFGTLSVSTAGLSFSTGDGTSDPTMTFEGTLANVNTALSNLQYQGLPNFNGNDAIQVSVSDQGNTGTGGARTDSDTIPVFLTGANDPPVLTTPSPQSAVEDVDSPITGVSVADPDVGNTTIRITLSAANGTITLNTRTGLTFQTGDGVADPTVTFTGSMTNVNNALASIVYHGNLNFEGAETLSVIADDLGNVGGPAQTDTGAITINVAGENDGPEISLPPAQNAPEDADYVINGVGITINDVDVGGGQIQIQLTVNNGVLTLSTLAGLTFTTGDGVQDATMTFRGTLSQVNAALNGLIYRANPNFNGFDSLTIIAGDLGNTGAGGPKMDSDVLQITVGEINDPPVITVPGVQSVAEDTTLNLTGVSVADPDINGSPIRISLAVNSGRMTLGTLTGLTFTTGDGSADAAMTFTGTLANANSALASLQYRGNENFNGTDTLTIVANDQGGTGAGGPKQDTESVVINVGAVNDGPSLRLPGPVRTANSAAPIVIDDEATVSDVDSSTFDGGTLTVRIVSNSTGSDRLGVRSQGSASGQANVSGNDIIIDGVVIGTYSGEVSNSSPLVITFNANATQARVQTLIRNIQYRIADAEPAASTRTIRFILADGDGDSSAPAEKQVRVAPSADVAVKFDTFPTTINNLSEFEIPIIVTNNGPLTATSVTLTHKLPTELNLRTASPARGTCSDGRTITCQLGAIGVGQSVKVVLRVYNTNVNTYEIVAEVTTSSDDPDLKNNKATISVWAAGENPPGDEKDKEEDRQRKLTEERRQQVERTNQLGLDDYRTEGNVTEVNFIVEQPFAIVMMRDGPQRIILPCKGGCPDVRVGDYLEADGVKENEQLFYAESVTLIRNGKKVR